MELIFGIKSCTAQQSPLKLVILRSWLIRALFPSSSTELFLDTQGPHEPFSAIVPQSCSLWRNTATQRSSSFDSLRRVTRVHMASAGDFVVIDMCLWFIIWCNKTLGRFWVCRPILSDNWVVSYIMQLKSLNFK